MAGQNLYRKTFKINKGVPMLRKIPVLIILTLVMSVSMAIAYTAEQANEGKQIFTRQCSGCHGASGGGGIVPDQVQGYAGMTVPPVVGKGALPNMKTAGNAYMFVKNHMPLASPGSLSEKEALDIVAFDLEANGVGKPDNQPLTPESASKIMLK
jgi:cytochrome c